MQAVAAWCATLCMSVWAQAAAHLVILPPLVTSIQHRVSPWLCTTTTLHRAAEQNAARLLESIQSTTGWSPALRALLKA